MPSLKIAGQGRKRPQINAAISQLHLDSENPRLPEETLGKGESEVLRVLYSDFNLDEIADSMAKNGYFDEEPLVATPQKLPSNMKGVGDNSQRFLSYIQQDSTKFTVVEGNRRLATAKLLLDPRLRDKLRIKHWPAISEEVADDLSELPVIVYKDRSEVVPYLGVRHIIGILKWDAYAKARYIAKMVDDGLSLDEVEDQIGDKQGAVRRNYVSYKLLQQAEDEFDYDIKQAKNDFSLLLLAIGQGNIKRFIGLPKKLSDTNFESPIPDEQIDNLKNLVSWIFGDENNSPVIRDSREITSYLSSIVASDDAVQYLIQNRDLIGAYDRSDGEENMIIKYLSTANRRLEAALGIAHRHKTTEVVGEIEKCEQTVKMLLKIVRDPND